MLLVDRVAERGLREENLADTVETEVDGRAGS